MFGQNPITNAFPKADGSLEINSHFYTIQGEGMDAGRPSYFIRLAKCNLRCHFCDTPFDDGVVLSLDQLTELVGKIKHDTLANGIVVTGGEPLLQNIIPLVEAANQYDLYVSVETAGTVYRPGLEKYFDKHRSIKGNLITCSPKTGTINKMLEPLVGAYKYIIKANETDLDDGLPNMSTQNLGVPRRIFRPKDDHIPIYVQPCDEQDVEKNRANMQVAAKVAMKYGYDLSLQIHKIVGLE